MNKVELKKNHQVR